MPPRRETPYRTDVDLHADEFRNGIAYTNWRPQGTPDWLLIHTVGGAGPHRHSGGEFFHRARGRHPLRAG
ncbi:MAG: hypothetical protein WDO13_05140, partial [Verrucomicrobiota bacterium]